MSAIVCGKRTFFEDLPTTPPVSKRIRCSSTSPIRFSPPRSSTTISFSQSPLSSDQNPNFNSPNPTALDHLQTIFPDMDKELFERVLEECGYDLDSAIRSLNELHLSSAERNLASDEDKTELPPQGVEINGGGLASSEDQLVPDNLPKNGAEWVELFVGEMTSASNMDDARARASRVLEVLEKSIRTNASTEAAQNFHKENMIIKEQLKALLRENTILKRAVAIQHDRQKEFDEKSHEVQHLKQVVVQYQEQLRTLEVNNYALTMHLQQAQQSNSIPGRFHPDVF